MENIAKIQLHQLEKRLAQQDMHLTVDKSVIKHVADIGYVPEFGARPLKRAIQQYVAVPLSQYLLKNPGAKKITVGVKNDEIVIS